jgi:pyruvate,water dikinase
LRAALRAFLDIRLNRWTDAALADAAAMVCYGALKASVARTFPDAASAHLHNSLLKGLTGLKSAEPVGELCRLAHAVRADARLRALFLQLPGSAIAERLSADPEFADFNAMFQRYLERWGFRCSGELMLTVPSFQERPGELLEIVRSYANTTDAGPVERVQAQRASRESITADTLQRARVQRLLPWLGWPNRATPLRALIAATQAAIGWRERARYQQALLYSRLRRIALAIGAKLSARGVLAAVDDVFFLSIQELDDLLSGVAMYPDQSAALVKLRRAAHAQFEQLTPADTLCAAAGEYPSSGSSRPDNPCVAGASVLHGISVCGGVVRGPAKVLRQVSETHALRPGDILVTRQTDPGWAPAFGSIGGLVLERGGMLSHGAILAREYGIPTVVAIAGVADRIGSGTLIEVDGDRGDVRLLA